MQSVLLVLHVLVAFALIGLILLQHGKGADTGAAFGSGASTTVFGARGSASFLTRATAILAFVFLANSFFLSYLSARQVEEQSLMERVRELPAGAAGTAPADGTGAGAKQEGRTESDLPDVPRD
jgi:preprotein translocase subunit SecG